MPTTITYERNADFWRDVFRDGWSRAWTEVALGVMARTLRDFFAHVESGTLVRNISKDREPGWALRQLPLVQTLHATLTLLAALEVPYVE